LSYIAKNIIIENIKKIKANKALWIYYFTFICWYW